MSSGGKYFLLCYAWEFLSFWKLLQKTWFYRVTKQSICIVCLKTYIRIFLMSINKILTIWENVHMECSNCCHGVVYHYRWQWHWDCCICKWSLHSLQALLSSSFLFQVDGFALPLSVQDKVFPVMDFGFLRFSCMREGPGLFHEWELQPLLCWSFFCFVIDSFGMIIRWEVTIYFLFKSHKSYCNFWQWIVSLHWKSVHQVT